MADLPIERGLPGPCGESTRRLLYGAILIGIVMSGAIVYTGGLDYPLYRDETQFWRLTRSFAESWPPSLEQLRGYREPMTPGSFWIWSGLQALFGGGIAAARAANVMLGAVCLGLIAFGATPRPSWAVLATCGLVLYPYFVPLSVHLYTDIPATAFVMLGFWFHARRLPVVGGVMFALAIATRQYMIVYPAALAAAELTPSILRRELDLERWRRMAPAILAGVTLLGWIAFFGGFGPSAGLGEWPRHTDAFDRISVDYGLYFLAGIGGYFVLPELVLFRRTAWLRSLRSRRGIYLGLAVAVVCWLLPPLRASLDPDVTYGAMNRGLMMLLPPEHLGAWSWWLRNVVYAGLIWLLLMRFRRVDAVTWILLANACLMMLMFEPWEKYFLPVLGVLWYFRSVDALEPERAFEPWAAATEARLDLVRARDAEAVRS